MVWKKIGTVLLFVVSAIVGVSNPANAGLIIADVELYQQRALSFESVLWFRGEHTELTGVYGASGVLVGSQWVLASSHQAYHGTGVQFNSMQFGTGNAISGNGEVRTVTNVFFYPGDPGFGYDLALYQLDNPITTVQPAALYDGTITIGMDSDIVGYGFVRDLGDNVGVYTGDKLAGNNVITKTGFFGNFTSTTLAHPVFDSNIFRELGMAATPGDSGGGLFIDGQLAASISFSNTGMGLNQYGVRTDYSPVQRSWMTSTMGASVPEPSSMTLLAIASAIGIARIRRRS